MLKCLRKIQKKYLYIYIFIYLNIKILTYDDVYEHNI